LLTGPSLKVKHLVHGLAKHLKYLTRHFKIRVFAFSEKHEKFKNWFSKTISLGGIMEKARVIVLEKGKNNGREPNFCPGFCKLFCSLLIN